MKKKAELGTIIIISIFVVIAGLMITFASERHRIVNYIGDSDTHVVYYIQSNNPNCNLKSISINQNNIVYFSNIEDIPDNYSFHEYCR